MLICLVIAGIAFGPTFLLVGLRLVAGPRASRAIWRIALRWLYVIVLGAGCLGLTWWAWVDGVAETDTGIQFGIALMLMGLILFSGAVTRTVASTRWIRTDHGVILP